MTGRGFWFVLVITLAVQYLLGLRFGHRSKEVNVKANPPNAAPGKKLSPAARRALEEAAERKSARKSAKPRPKETAGPKGAEPTRFGDWERGGITYDF